MQTLGGLIQASASGRTRTLAQRVLLFIVSTLGVSACGAEAEYWPDRKDAAPLQPRRDAGLAITGSDAGPGDTAAGGGDASITSGTYQDLAGTGGDTGSGTDAADSGASDGGAQSDSSTGLGDSGTQAESCRQPIEYDPSSAVYVAPDGDDAHSGLTPLLAVRRIVTAIEIAMLRDKDHVLIAAGHYDEEIYHNEAAEIATIKSFLGGFNRDFTERDTSLAARSDPDRRTYVRELALAEMREDKIVVDGFVFESLHAGNMAVQITNNTVITSATGMHLNSVDGEVAYNHITTPFVANDGTVFDDEEVASTIVGILVEDIASNPTVHHNIVHLVRDRGADTLVGIVVQGATDETVIAQNTLAIASTRGHEMVGVVASGSTLVVNNLIETIRKEYRDSGTCVSGIPPALFTVRHNNLYCDLLWSSTEGELVELDTPFTTAEGDTRTLASQGNFKLDPAPYWTGSDGFALASSAPPELRGGATALDEYDVGCDASGAPHTREFSGGLPPGSGWSVGVYESD